MASQTQGYGWRSLPCTTDTARVLNLGRTHAPYKLPLSEQRLRSLWVPADCAVCEEGYGSGYQYSCSSCVGENKGPAIGEAPNMTQHRPAAVLQFHQPVSFSRGDTVVIRDTRDAGEPTLSWTARICCGQEPSVTLSIEE